jgi:tetratricopeptide (TPR) repeat protein
LDLLELELDNLRLAFEWAVQADIEAALKLATALEWFWQIRSRFSEGIDWLVQGLETEKKIRIQSPEASVNAAVRAKALVSLGFHRWMQLHRYTQKEYAPEQVKDLLEEGISLFQTLDPEHSQDIRQGLAWAQVRLGGYKLDVEGDPDQAQVLAQDALDSFQKTGDFIGMLESLRLLASCELGPVRAKSIYQKQLAISEEYGDISGIANALFRIGVATYVDGEYGNACSIFEESLEQFRRVNDPVGVARNWLLIGEASLISGNLQQADQYIQKSLASFYELGYDNRIALCLFAKSLLHVAQGRYDQAALTNEEALRIAQKTGIPTIDVELLYISARLARISGDSAAAQKHIRDLLNCGGIQPHPRMLASLELGHLALRSGNLNQASQLFQEGLQVLLRMRETVWIPEFLDGLALLAVRQGQMERAARLFGTRWCRGYAHFLSPIEQAWRQADLAEMQAILGEARYAQLYEEARTMTFMQAVALALEAQIE